MNTSERDRANLEKALSNRQIDVDSIGDVALDIVYTRREGKQAFLDLVQEIATQHGLIWEIVEEVVLPIALRCERELQIYNEMKTIIQDKLRLLIDQLIESEYQRLLPDIKSGLLSTEDVADQLSLALGDVLEMYSGSEEIEAMYLRERIASLHGSRDTEDNADS